jgi:glycosyltransferase involved in cell wall biosynthesis
MPTVSPPAATVSRPLAVLVKVYPKLSETFILEELLGLERLGLSLRLYALSPPTDTIAHPAVQAVRAPLVRVPHVAWTNAREFAIRHAIVFCGAPLRHLRTLMHALRRGRSGWQDFLRAGWLAVQLRRDGVSHLHAHFISLPAGIAELVHALTALPFSISAHAKDIYLSDAEDLRRKLHAATFTVTCTDANRAALAAIAPDARVHRMYHGVDQTLFRPRRRILPLPADEADAPLILSVGRLRPKKGLHHLVEACALLRDRGVRVRCEIVGYGDERARLEALVERHALGDRVHFLGKLAREAVIERYAQATVYVQPSCIAADGDRDGIPNVLLEAMACGLPVVATRVSGIPELVDDGGNGLLVEPDDPAALAAAIAHLLARPHLCGDLGCRARDAVVSRFDNDRNLQLLCALLAPGATPVATLSEPAMPHPVAVTE